MESCFWTWRLVNVWNKVSESSLYLKDTHTHLHYLKETRPSLNVLLLWKQTRQSGDVHVSIGGIRVSFLKLVPGSTIHVFFAFLILFWPPDETQPGISLWRDLEAREATSQWRSFLWGQEITKREIFTAVRFQSCHFSRPLCENPHLNITALILKLHRV